ncbi:hypothetical protein M0811_01075 [Anaeramoeba ignava]|uniref:Uncharacterized protein n=1 Tax=Anaeramoeba ignava TaxID=1746090 RepID=A0A9Q0RD77_ANAIG|nr:hypothetical protein M0811_01075 [Anaeramoeba ignava]
MNKKRSKPNLENKTKRNRKNISTKKLIFSEEIIEKPNFFYICDLVLPQEIFQSRKAKEEDREQDSQQFLSLWQHAAAVEPDLFFQIVKTITIYRGFNCTECRMIDLVISKFIVKNQVQGIELIKNIGKQMRNGKLEYSQRNAFFAQILSSISTLSNKTEKFLTDLILAISAETVEGDDPLADFLKDCLLQVQENYRCLIINNLLSNQMNSNINENNSNQEFHNEKQFKSMEIEKNSQNSQKNNGNSGKFSDPVLFLFQQIINSEYENNSSQKIMENALPAFLTKFSHLKFTKQQREYLSLGNFLSTQFSNLIHNNFIRFYAKLQIIRGLFTSKFQKETHINNEALVYNEYDCLGILESSFSENRGNLTEIIIPSIFFKVNEESKAFRTKLLSLILANGSNLATVFSTEGSCISFLNTISGRKKFQNHESDEIKSIRKFISKESIQSAWMQNTQPEYDPSRRPQAKISTPSL